MKYIFAITAAAFLILTVGTGIVGATNSKDVKSDKTRVRGNVYDAETGAVAGLTVTVTCRGNTRTATTASSGLYVVDYTSDQCKKFDAVTASATHNGETQTNTVLVSAMSTATIDFFFGIANVPEFGMIPGIVAAAGSGLAYLGMKRKQLF